MSAAESETDEQIVHLGHSEHAKAEALGVTVERGYLYWVRPERPDAIDCSTEHTDPATGQVVEEDRRYGYHGLDVPPCEGAYVADEEGGDGYLVISDSAEAPECVDGWSAEDADDLEPGWYSYDGTCHTVLLCRVPDGEATICSTVRS